MFVYYRLILSHGVENTENETNTRYNCHTNGYKSSLQKEGLFIQS